MTEENSTDDLVKIVLKLGEEKQNLQIGGMGCIHPIYEALVALLRRHLPDEDILSRFIKTEESLKEVLLTDALLGYLKNNSEAGIKLRSFLVSGSSLNDIINTAAIYIAEDKRSHDGKVLYCAKREADKDKHFMKSLRYADPNSVFILTSEIDGIRQKAGRIRRIKRAAIAVALSLAATFVGAAYTAYYLNYKSCNSAPAQVISGE